MYNNPFKLLISLLLLTVSISSSADEKSNHDNTATEVITHNDSLALKVIEIFTLDQGIRDSSIKTPDNKCKVISQLDSICFSKAIMFIKKHGWPTAKMLGKYKNYEAARAGFLPIMLHHPDKMNNPKVHDILVKEVLKGNLNPQTCALFFDKYWVCYEHKSMYNTAFKAWTKHNGVLREDRKKSDELMRELGLDILPESDFVDKKE